jgi:hypothetical protein
MKIADALPSIANEMYTGIEQRVNKASCLEDAAQALARDFHEKFTESVVIARVFVTVPFEALPESNRDFVQNLVASSSATELLTPTTPVLSLIGSYGDDKEWQDRRTSKGHVGVPLVSSAFVGAIPMIARLLKELGIPMKWIDQHDSEMIIRTIGKSSGLFFVDEAAEARDHVGRKIITAQDFVSAHEVHSVFGIGGAYEGGEILIVVVFCRDAFSRATAKRFLPVIKSFIAGTGGLAGPAHIFRA